MTGKTTLTCAALLSGAAFLTAALPASGSGTVMVPGASFGNLQVKVKSLKELRFGDIVQQQYDFSCGSAALATLLTHHYEHPVSEGEVLREMFERGDREKIRREGFSLLDMKNYLESHGFSADGFRITLDQLQRVGVPAIVLINRRGFMHFVVLQGVRDREVLMGDPALGSIRVPRPDFERMWNGLVFLIRNKKETAQRHFNDRKDWNVQVGAPLAQGLAGDRAMGELLMLPVRNGP